MWHLPIEEFHRIMGVEPPAGLPNCFFIYPTEQSRNMIFRNGLPEEAWRHKQMMEALARIEKLLNAERRS